MGDGMKTTAIALAALAGIATAHAAEQPVGLKQLADAPKSYVGRKITVSGIGCVDDPKGGFVCLATVGGQAVRIEATVLGGKTKSPITERLIGDCRGTANLTRPACRVDVEIEATTGYRDVVQTASGTLPVSVLVSPRIDMFAPKGR